MPDITITITTHNISDKERQQLYRDIATLTARLVRITDGTDNTDGADKIPASESIPKITPILSNKIKSSGLIRAIREIREIRDSEGPFRITDGTEPIPKITPIRNNKTISSSLIREIREIRNSEGPFRITDDADDADNTDKTPAIELIPKITPIQNNKTISSSLIRAIREIREIRNSEGPFRIADDADDADNTDKTPARNLIPKITSVLSNKTSYRSLIRAIRAIREIRDSEGPSTITENTPATEPIEKIMSVLSNKTSYRSLIHAIREIRKIRDTETPPRHPRFRHQIRDIRTIRNSETPPQNPLSQLHTQFTQLPNDLFNATYNAIVQIPIQTRIALQQLNTDTTAQIRDIHNSHILSAQQKADQIQRIEQQAAKRRVQIEQQANQAKIRSYQKVVQNFIKGIGRMIAEQLKLRTAAVITNAVLGTQTPKTRHDTTRTNPIGSLISTFIPVLATHPALAIGSGLALGAARLFSSSFDDPINDAIARQAGINQAHQRATELGRRSAVDLTKHFVHGFATETANPTTPTDTAPVVRNEIKLIIGTQELKAIYEETQRQIKTGTITKNT